MTIKALRPLPGESVEVKRTPRCQEDTSQQNDYQKSWRERRYQVEGSPFRCVRPSVVKMDGKYLCRLHAGHKCLSMYLNGELIRKSKP